jgi:hypothetical protein
MDTTFLDIRAIGTSPKGDAGKSLTIITDWDDTNPTNEFTAWAYDNNGSRVTTNFSYTARGIEA